MNVEAPFELDSRALVPDAWQQARPASAYFVFNPAIAPWRNTRIMAYRVVAPGYAAQRIAACHLHHTLGIVPGSVVPFSDTLPGAPQHVADPRLFWYEAELYMLYSDYRTPDQLQLVAVNPATLEAADRPRPLLLTPRQTVEKNWMPFAHKGCLYAIYSIAPHVVLELNLRHTDYIPCTRRFAVTWDMAAYTRRFGGPRGGAPPVLVGDRYFVFFHSSAHQGFLHSTLRRLKQRLHPGGRASDDTPPGGRASGDSLLPGLCAAYTRRFLQLRYAGGFYAFAAEPPFAPVLLAPTPVLLPENETPALRTDRLRPIAREVVFPTGAILDAEQRWLVAYGVHDERCMLRTLPHRKLVQWCQKAVMT